MASPADLNLVCCTGAGETETDITGTGIDFISADNALNTSGNRTSNPITIPAAGFAYSYSKWLKFELGTTEPDTQVTNFKFWGGGITIDSGKVKDYYRTTITYAQPAAVTTNTGYTVVTAATAGAKASIAGTLNSQGDATSFLVMMLEVSTAAAQGNMTQQTYNYSYDEN
jgi:hypothetical protein